MNTEQATGTKFARLFDAIRAEEEKRHNNFINGSEGLNSYDTKEKILSIWFYKDMLTPSKLVQAQKLWGVDRLKLYLIQRDFKKRARTIAQRLAHLQEVEKAGALGSVTVSIEWKKSRMWGSNPKAEARVMDAGGNFAGMYYTDNISGCGYDKESTAVAQAVNQSPVFLRALYEYKEQHGADKKNHELFGYGSGYGVLPHLEGGVGVSCFPRIMEKIGFDFKNTASGKAFDVYTISKKQS